MVGIYNSRNYSILLNVLHSNFLLTIYNSRNYSILLNAGIPEVSANIYNSRNYSILLNISKSGERFFISTTVEIILYYLTPNLCICTIFWSQATLFLLFYITFAQYMLSNIDYYKIEVQVCITLWWKNHFLHFWHNHILELHSLMTFWKYIHYLIVKIVFQMCSSNR